MRESSARQQLEELRGHTAVVTTAETQDDRSRVLSRVTSDEMRERGGGLPA